MTSSRKFITSLMANIALLGSLLVPTSLCAQITAVRDNNTTQEREQQIPAGTIIPVGLVHGFSSKNAKAGQSIAARVMQDVPLEANSKIPVGAEIFGTVLSAEHSANHGTARITF